jgi:hypothetical protein
VPGKGGCRLNRYITGNAVDRRPQIAAKVFPRA